MIEQDDLRSICHVVRETNAANRTDSFPGNTLARKQQQRRRPRDACVCLLAEAAFRKQLADRRVNPFWNGHFGTFRFAGSSRGNAFSPYPYRACAHKRQSRQRGRARHVSGQRGHGRRGDHDRGIHVWQAVTVWLAPGVHACPAGLPGSRSRVADHY